MKTSVLFSFAVAAALLACGCATRRYMADAKHPEVVVTPRGQLEFCGERIDADDLPAALSDAGYAKNDTINIRVPADIRDYRFPYYVMGVLAKSGYRRPVLVKESRAYTVTGAGAHAASMPGDRTVDGILKKPSPPPQGQGRVVYPRR